MNPPKITGGIITYNRPKFLREAVDSVLLQSFKDFELIISNDYVDVPVTLDSLGIENDGRIKIVNQVCNLGELKNMNFLLEVAQGEWFVWLADDDLIHPEFLALANEAILKFGEKDVAAFFSNYSSGNCPDGVFPPRLKSNQPSCDGTERFLLDYSSRRKPLIGCYGVMNVAALRKVGGMPRLGNSFSPYGDTLIPILLAEHGMICWLDEPLVFLRTHPDSLSCNAAEFSAYTSAEVDFLERLRRVCGNMGASIKTDKVIANMVKWFSINEWMVLCRTSSLGKYALTKQFIEYQLSVNFPRLSLRHKFHHLLFTVRFLGMRLLLEVHARLRTAFEGMLAVAPGSGSR